MDEEELRCFGGTPMRKGDYVNIVRGLFARLLFTSHAFLCARQYSHMKGTKEGWFMLLLLIVVYGEFIILIVLRRGKEWKWFFLSILCYLLAVVPTLWTLEIEALNTRVENSMKMGEDDCGIKTMMHNKTQTVKMEKISVLLGLRMTDQEWSLVLQQKLLFVLIIGRWILPRGPITSDQLSQLLLVYIGIGADILEFSTEGLRLPSVQCNSTVIIVILSVWTASLLQFTLSLTLRKRPKPRQHVKGFKKFKFLAGTCCATEVWSILVTVCMQDGPFLLVRIYLIIFRKVFNQLLLFFAFKNLLVIFLQCYRLWVLLNRRLDVRRSHRKRVALKIANVRKVEEGINVRKVEGEENDIDESQV
ncbi:transmembrane protein 26-like isoform X2 [Anneissia japonica]|uniref:transmembrane protein 26-like isoform X1 n=1 Tax=Anneissia japonica TaxID=1529436 RepID=UPI00142558EB|nr:transmembrane protein 26-like isoform X1 [Anneissia japonica]XP_033100335.1 transmembrane protein 26-like isoform X2 [Anneissia japonica]